MRILLQGQLFRFPVYLRDLVSSTMKTLKLLIKTSFFNKVMILCASILSNKSLMEEATKCLFRTSLRSTHSTRMCFTVSGH